MKHLLAGLLRHPGAAYYHKWAPLSIPACKDFVHQLTKGSLTSPIWQKRLQVTTVRQFLAFTVRWASGFSNKSSSIESCLNTSTVKTKTVFTGQGGHSSYQSLRVIADISLNVFAILGSICCKMTTVCVISVQSNAGHSHNSGAGTVKSSE